jgi:D-psicose/D-tagatose/L-ribulose 3-epimerase
MLRKTIGIHVSLWTPQWTDDIVDHIHTAKRLGFGAVELPIMDPGSFPLERCQQALSETGLTVYCGTGLNPTNELSSTNATVVTRGVEHLAQCLAIAHAIGSKSLEGVIHSAWGRQTPITAEEYGNMVAALRQTADAAAEKGMFLGLECINRYESSVLNTVDQGLALLAEIQRPNVGLHLDTYHMNIEENSIVGAIRRCNDTLKFIHLSENNRGYPGSGHLPWKDIIQALREISYDGPIVIESYVNPQCPSGTDVSIWRAIESDTQTSLQKSLSFISGLMG